MVRVTRSFTVSKAADAVLSYLKDFGNAVEWDPGTESCQRQDSGPVVVGSSWHNVSLFLGRRTELIYRLDVAEPGHLVFTGTNTGATSTDDIRIADVGPGTSQVTYRADLQLHGAARLASFAVKLALERIGDRLVTQMQKAISAL